MADIKVRLDQKPDTTSIDLINDRFVGRFAGKIKLATPTQQQEMVENIIGIRHRIVGNVIQMQYKNGSGNWVPTGTEWPF